MQFPQELESELVKKNVVLFAGAGLSIGAGLPGWSDLIEPLARASGSPWPSNQLDLTAIHLLNAAQSYENRKGRHALITHLRKKLTTTEVRPTKAHQLLSQFPWPIVFTTNYDDLIERAFLNVSHAMNVIVDQSDIPFWDTSHTQIVKLCGDLARPKSIVVTARDFNTYLSVYPRMAERLRTALEMNTALFLGYSLQDPFFNQIWDRITADFGSLQRVGYAVFFDASALEIDDLHHRNIKVISLKTDNRDRTDVLVNWLIELVKHWDDAGSDSQARWRQPYDFEDQIAKKLDAILHGQAEMKQGIMAVYSSIKRQDKAQLASILNSIEQGRIEQGELIRSVDAMRRWARQVQISGLPVEEELRVAILALTEGVEDKQQLKQYLEANLPLIPGLLSYKVELGTEHNTDLRALWDELRRRLM